MKRLIYAAVSLATYRATHVEYAGRSCVVLLQDVNNSKNTSEYIIGQPGTTAAEEKAREFLNSENIDIPTKIVNEITRTFFEV